MSIEIKTKKDPKTGKQVPTGLWVIKYRGQRYATRDRKHAEEVHRCMKAGARLPERPENDLLKTEWSAKPSPLQGVYTVQRFFEDSISLWKGKDATGSRTALKRFCETLGMDKPLEKCITPLALYDAKEHMQTEEEIANGTWNNRLSALSKALKHAVDMQVLRKMPKLPSREKIVGNKIVWLTVEEERKICDYFMRNDRPFFACMVRVLCLTGMRISELLTLDYYQIKPDDGWIKLLKTKNGHERDVPIRMPELAWELRNYLEAGGKFPNYRWFYEQLVRAVAACQIGKHVTPHTCRHTAATRLIKLAKIPTATVQLYLGHLRIETTQLYVHIEKDDIRDAGDAYVVEIRKQWEGLSLITPTNGGRTGEILGENGGETGAILAFPGENRKRA